MDKEIAHQTDAMLHQAEKSIDALFGNGFAKEHPELVGNFIVAGSNNNIAAAIDYLSKEFERKSFCK